MDKNGEIKRGFEPRSFDFQSTALTIVLLALLDILVENYSTTLDSHLKAYTCVCMLYM